MNRLAIHSAPRSGSSWLGYLVDAHPNIIYKFQPLFSYELKGFLDDESSKDRIDEFFRNLRITESDFLDQSREKEKGIVPSSTKNDTKLIAYKEVRYHHILPNLLEKDKQLRLIGLVRDPRAVLYSWWKAPREFDQSNWTLKEEWNLAEKKNQSEIENFYGYQKWKESAELFLKLKEKHPDQVRVLKYSNLLENTLVEMENLMYFCGLNLHQQQVDFINQSKQHHSQDAYAVYKVKSNDKSWKLKLPEEIVITIEEDLHNTQLSEFLS